MVVSNLTACILQGRPWFLGIRYFGVFIVSIRYFNAKYWVFSTNFGYKVYDVFSNFVFVFMNFKLFLGILDDYFRVYWYSTTPPPHLLADPDSCYALHGHFIVILFSLEIYSLSVKPFRLLYICFSFRFTEEEWDQMCIDAPIDDEGYLNYFKYTKIIKHGKDDDKED